QTKLAADQPGVEQHSVQATALGAGRAESSGGIDSRIQDARGGGQLLGGSTRAFFEPRFGADMGGVHLHTGAEADALNRTLHSRAFTTGRDIFFRRGEY